MSAFDGGRVGELEREVARLRRENRAITEWIRVMFPRPQEGGDWVTGSVPIARAAWDALFESEKV